MKDEEKFSAFLFETMPFVAKLADVIFESNNVQSFQPIVQRLGNVTSPGRLRILNIESFRERRGYWLVRLSTNENINRARTSDTPGPGWKEELRKEREAVQPFLGAYRELQDFIRTDHEDNGFRGIAEQLYHMEINHAGRVLVESSIQSQKRTQLFQNLFPYPFGRESWQELGTIRKPFFPDFVAMDG